MVGVIFAICCKLQKIIFTDSICACLYNLEYTLCQSSGLIKYGNLCFTQKLQIVTSFYKDTCLGCSADSTEETKWNGDDQCTWTGYYQKDQCTVEPFTKFTYKDRRNDRYCKCKETYDRCIVFCKSGNELLVLCFSRTCIFHQFQNLRYGRIVKFLWYLDTDHTVLVNHAT